MAAFSAHSRIIILVFKAYGKHNDGELLQQRQSKVIQLSSALDCLFET